MEQRRLRLGDILDDYCPRERRVTNHAVVAMIDETVKQTRCTTCDAEHVYKGGQAPRRKKKETTGALYREVLAGKPDDLPATVAAAAPRPDAIEAPVQAARDEELPHLVTPGAAAVDGELDASSDELDDDASLDDDGEVNGNLESSYERDVEEGPVHRQLIRATLPRPEGQKDARTPPDFTIRQSHGGRGGNQPGGAHFRGNNANRPRGPRGGPGQGAQGQGGNGNRPFAAGGNSHAGSHSGSRFGRQGQPGHGRGQGQGAGNFRNPQQPRQGGGGRKRSR